MTRRYTRPRAYAPDPGAPGQTCDAPGCDKLGEYRAPRSRAALNDYLWFCLDHVREYNSAWDYYRGMSPGQIEAEVRSDTGWQRPTWPLGQLGSVSSAGRGAEDTILDSLDILGGRRRAAEPPRQASPPGLREPLSILGLEWPVSLDQLKVRYKELAKRHHPDRNGGDRAAEERLKRVNLAYAAVRRYLTGGTPLAATG
ncbi:MAG: J domain-containing protein [Acetobacteraceae bacterium]|nr:J domain-containing protein [Acetobacteraceae bacterium]